MFNLKLKACLILSYDKTEGQICKPASKVCDGYLDMLLNATGSFNQACTIIYANPRPAIQGKILANLEKNQGNRARFQDSGGSFFTPMSGFERPFIIVNVKRA
jgi:hypothetical protein